VASAIDTSELRRLANRMRGAGRQRVRSAVRRSLLKAAKHIRGRAVDLAPMKFGALRGSGHEALDGADLAVKVLFGGAASAYAAVQHERGDFAHTIAAWRAKNFPSQRKPPRRGYQGGQAHFLFGRADSAYEANHALVMAWLETEAGKALRELVRS